MSNHIIRIKSIDKVTHDVLRIVTDKPSGFSFIPGQASRLAVNKTGWYKEERPFTFTNLPTSEVLEFTIKTYPKKEGMTNQLLKLKPHDELILHPVFGTIHYQGQGVFIAGGAGVTPFISILRSLKAKGEIGENSLLFANKTKADIILEKELSALLGDAFVNILSDEEIEGYAHGIITKSFLKANITDYQKQFYVCGPPPMIAAVEDDLLSLGVSKNHIIKEVF